MDEPTSKLAMEETGEPVDALLWPPRVLEEQPLSLIMQQIRIQLRSRARLVLCHLALRPSFHQHQLRPNILHLSLLSGRNGSECAGVPIVCFPIWH